MLDSFRQRFGNYSLFYILIIFCLGYSCVRQPDTAMQGSAAPDIVQNNTVGTQLKLSDLRGKIVLVDFWASWCRPCRMKNPSLVKLYDQFRDKEFSDATGFEIFSVSLDENKSAWINAIAKDKLQWKYHVSDLKGWRNQAAIDYKVDAIPASFLLDENGVIICSNCSVFAIERELNKRLAE